MQLDTEWVQPLQRDPRRGAPRSSFLAAALFALGILVIVGNTIRLDIENRRGEIEVTKLVGGSDAFVRRPFLYNGVWYGLGGGLIAWPDRQPSSIAGAERTGAAHCRPVRQQVRAARVSASIGRVALLLGGALLGWLGSFIVATRELRGIEPK